jgi:transposase InsO family protein
VPTASCSFWYSSPAIGDASGTWRSPRIRRRRGPPNSWEAFPWDEAPRYLIHDRDHALDSLRGTAKAMTIEDVLTAPRAPWQNAFVERFIGSARRECFDHVILFNEAGLKRLMTLYCSYYE